jgi:hypothetical protein
MTTWRDELITEIRDNTGIPVQGPDGLSDAAVTRQIGRALENLSLYLPRRVITYVESTAGTQDYTISTNTPTWVLAVWPASGGFPTVDSYAFDTIVDPAGGDASVSMYVNPSLYEVSLQRMQAIRRIASSSYSWNADTGVLKIMPCPSETGAKYYYLAAYIWTSSNIPDRYHNVLLMFAEAYAIKTWIVKSARLSGIQQSGGLKNRTNLRELRELGEKMEEDAIKAAKTLAATEGFKQG